MLTLVMALMLADPVYGPNLAQTLQATKTKTQRHNIKSIKVLGMKLIICLKCHLGSSVLESGSTDSVTKTPITPGREQAEEKILCLNMLFFLFDF